MRLFLAALAVAASATPAVAAEQRFSRTLEIGPAAPILIDATIADLVVEGGSRRDVAVQIVRHAPHESDFDRYPVVVDDTGGGCRIRVVQAENGVDAALKTEIRLAVPVDAVLEAVHVFEGHIRLANLRGAANVAIRRGTIEATAIAGRVRLESELGSLDLRNAELTAGGMMHLRVFNGDVHLRLARRPTDARVLAVTYNGSITSDIPLATKDRFGPHFGETSIGAGEPVLSIDVVKGNIDIRVAGR